MKRSRLNRFVIIFCGIVLLLIVLIGGSILLLSHNRVQEYRYQSETTETEPVDIAGKLDELEGLPAAHSRYTLLIYMIGTDLESNQTGYATENLEEIQAAVKNTTDVNVLVLTGGTKDWVCPDITDGAYELFLMTEDGLELLCDLGEQSMGDPALLAGFVNAGKEYFPSDHTGLLCWNHGAGSIYGFGCDELSDESLYLTDMKTAFASSIAKEEPLDFIGFDACLMGTMEVACVLSPYADFLVGSEETMSGTGWDYSFIQSLDKKALRGDATEEICQLIVDGFIEKQSTQSMADEDMQATLSVINLQSIGYLTDAVESFSIALNKKLLLGDYSAIARIRSDTKAFGVKADPQKCYDMVDLESLADDMHELVPNESMELKERLKESIVYSAHSENVEAACGLSIFFPFKCTQTAVSDANELVEIGILPQYSSLIKQFAQHLSEDEFDFSHFTSERADMDEDGNVTVQLTEEELDNTCNIFYTLWEEEEEVEPGVYYYIELAESSDLTIGEDGLVTTHFDGNWSALNDRMVCMYELDHSEEEIRYGIPAYLNGRDVDLIVICDKKQPFGRVIGACPNYDSDSNSNSDSTDDTDEMMNQASREILKIKQGDEIVLCYWAELFVDEEKVMDPDASEAYEDGCWYEGEAWTVPKEGLTLSGYSPDSEQYLYGFSLIDTANHTHYTEFQSVVY